MYEEKSGGQTKGRVVRNEIGKEARSLVSHNEDFELYAKCALPMNKQMYKQMHE